MHIHTHLYAHVCTDMHAAHTPRHTCAHIHSEQCQFYQDKDKLEEKGLAVIP